MAVRNCVGRRQNLRSAHAHGPGCSEESNRRCLCLGYRRRRGSSRGRRFLTTSVWNAQQPLLLTCLASHPRIVCRKGLGDSATQLGPTILPPTAVPPGRGRHGPFRISLKKTQCSVRDFCDSILRLPHSLPSGMPPGMSCNTVSGRHI